MKNLGFIVSILMLLSVTACNKEYQEFKMQPAFKGNDDNTCFDAKKLKIAVLSDLHFMEPSLLKADAAIQAVYGISPDLAAILSGLYTDLPPHDYELVVDLN